MSRTAVEYEIIALKALTEAFDGILNHSLLSVVGREPDCEIRFPSPEHQQLFTILLLDTLEQGDAEYLGPSRTLIDALVRIAEAPQLVAGDAVTPLREATTALTRWLGTMESAEVWLPLLGRTITLSLDRSEVVYLSGNMSKHGFARLTGVASRIHRIALRSDFEVSRDQVIELLEPIYECLHDDVLSYHATALVELLNNTRWALHAYLKPEFQRAYKQLGDGRYRFLPPMGGASPFVAETHWELMNDVRRGPYLPRFSGAEILKRRGPET